MNHSRSDFNPAEGRAHRSKACAPQTPRRKLGLAEKVGEDASDALPLRAPAPIGLRLLAVVIHRAMTSDATRVLRHWRWNCVDATHIRNAEKVMQRMMQILAQRMLQRLGIRIQMACKQQVVGEWYRNYRCMYHETVRSWKARYHRKVLIEAQIRAEMNVLRNRVALRQLMVAKLRLQRDNNLVTLGCAVKAHQMDALQRVVRDILQTPISYCIVAWRTGWLSDLQVLVHKQDVAHVTSCAKLLCRTVSNMKRSQLLWALLAMHKNWQACVFNTLQVHAAKLETETKRLGMQIKFASEVRFATFISLTVSCRCAHLHYC